MKEALNEHESFVKPNMGAGGQNMLATNIWNLRMPAHARSIRQEIEETEEVRKGKNESGTEMREVRERRK